LFTQLLLAGGSPQHKMLVQQAFVQHIAEL
jgi:hypothetical protein